jgi:hypothetical protein
MKNSFKICFDEILFLFSDKRFNSNYHLLFMTLGKAATISVRAELSLLLILNKNENLNNLFYVALSFTYFKPET